MTSYFSIPLTEVITIGDGTNDIPLLNKAGLAITMGKYP
ncbi:HAD hydrolase family protein [Chloroflexota bacterium]